MESQKIEGDAGRGGEKEGEKSVNMFLHEEYMLMKNNMIGK